MFNQSNIIARHQAGEFTLVPRPKANPSKRPNHPKDTKSQHVVFQDKNGDEVATGHYYLCPTGPVTDIDPKTLKIGNLRYTVCPNPKDANPDTSVPYVMWAGTPYQHVMLPVQ